MRAHRLPRRWPRHPSRHAARGTRGDPERRRRVAAHLEGEVDGRARRGRVSARRRRCRSRQPPSASASARKQQRGRCGAGVEVPGAALAEVARASLARDQRHASRRGPLPRRRPPPSGVGRGRLAATAASQHRRREPARRTSSCRRPPPCRARRCRPPRPAARRRGRRRRPSSLGRRSCPSAGRTSRTGARLRRPHCHEGHADGLEQIGDASPADRCRAWP